MHEPLERAHATREIHRVASRPDAVGFTTHGLDELAADALAPADALRVLRNGRVRHPIRLDEGTWRYRVWSGGVCVVVAFEREFERLVVVTAWRDRRGGGARESGGRAHDDRARGNAGVTLRERSR